MVITRTPFRISFFGGGTDYPAWYTHHGGSVLATTINKYCYLTVRYLPPFFGNKYRIAYSKIETCKSVEQIEHPSVREIIKYLKIDKGLEIHHDGDLPARSGLGSSSAFTVGLLHALYALQGKMPNKHQLATESIYLEREILKEAVGSQDQMLAAHGGFKHFTFHTEGHISVHPITLSHTRIEELENHLMLFYTGIVRTASDIAKGYSTPAENQRRQLRIIHNMVDEAMSVLGSNQNIKAFGQLMDESWQLKKSLSSAVSTNFINEIYQEATNSGAIGGKIIGAGGGGFLLLFVQPSHHLRVKRKLQKLLQVPFKFETEGSQVIFYDQQEDYSINSFKIKKSNGLKIKKSSNLYEKTT